MGTVAGTVNTAKTYERPIVVRTRLLELLDTVQQRTVLLTAPAGYGKTTLARQWLDRVGGAWVTITPASRDVPVLARDLAAAVASVTDLDVIRVEKALSASATSEAQAIAVARTILAQVQAAIPSWIVLDDYHYVAGAAASDDLISRLERSGRFRFLITTRERPAWATTRRRLYMETVELGAADLALDELETSELLPPDRRTVALRRQALGWPALIALAAHSRLSDADLDPDALSATLYDYFAEEIFERASADVQAALTAIAVLPPLNVADARARLGADVVASAIRTGLAYEDDDEIRVHPLARSFLLAKVKERPDASAVVRDAFELAMERDLFDVAFTLIKDFDLTEQLERLIIDAYAPLLESGRVATLQVFGRYAAERGAIPVAVRDVIAADAALCSGELLRAEPVATSAAERLPAEHPLRARAYIISGTAAHLLHRNEDALTRLDLARKSAKTRRDDSAAAWGRCQATLHLEDDRFEDALREFEALQPLRPSDRVRLDNIRTSWSILSGSGLRACWDPETGGLVSAVTDPWARTGWGLIHGTALVLQARYADAEVLLRETLLDLNEFKLAFGLPHVEWTLAAAELGQRHFARCEALLRRVDRRLARDPNVHTELNVRALRARLHLAQQRVDDALVLTRDDFVHDGRAMYGEYLATRALALAAAGELDNALAAAARAEDLTRVVDAQILAAATRAVVALTRGPDDAIETLLETASRLAVWDGLVCAVRAVPRLMDPLTGHPRYRIELREVLLRSNDLALAKAARLVTRGPNPRGALSPREREIIEHVRQGKRNAEIAESLFIALGTVKRHLDHIYDKLGARSRAEAIARYAEIETVEREAEAGT